jgi:cytochrome d ubiquinol oxidase subunit I
MLVACFVTTGFVVVGVNAWYLLRGMNRTMAKHTLSMTLWLLTILVPAQIFIGDLHGLNTLEHQPAKIAAMEGHWETRQGAPILLFALPDQQRETNDFEIGIPKLGSLILTHSLDQQVPALKEFAPEDRANSTIVFWTFRVMVALGLLMILTGLWGLWLRSRNKLFENRAFLHLLVWMGPSGIIAMLAGWYTTEIGRQPWVIQGLMRTADASSGHGLVQMSLTLTLFVVVYFALFGVGLGYMMRLVRKGPITGEGLEVVEGGPGQKHTPSRPLSAAEEDLHENGSDTLPERN